MSTIPASLFVNVIPNVLAAGGNSLVLNAVALTNGTRVPIGSVLGFPSVAAVEAYFGGGSAEAIFAGGGVGAGKGYFGGFENSNKKPGNIFFTQYNQSAVSGYLRGGALGMTLAELKAVTPGTLTITFGGTGLTSASIDLSGATSFSNAAATIQAAFTLPDFAVAYDSVSDAFVFTSTATGAAATIVYPSNTIATALKLTAATGAILSQGADAATPGTFMDAVVQQTQNWASFTTTFDPDSANENTVKMEFAAWANGTNDRFLYVPFDTDVTPTQSVPAVTSLGYKLQQANYSGTAPIYDPDNSNLPAFVCGAIASIDFRERNGRITLAYKSQTGLVASTTTEAAAVNLGGNPQVEGSYGNGYNYYGAVATANQNFLFFQRGSVSGPYLWIDSYVNQIWLNSELQLALMVFMTSVKSIPYNAAGYTLIEQALADPIQAGLNFGMYGPGSISSSQIAQINNAAGIKITDTLQAQGWYLQILDAASEVRAARGSPPMKFWYLDRGSVQAISLTSIAVQ